MQPKNYIYKSQIGFEIIIINVNGFFGVSKI